MHVKYHVILATIIKYPIQIKILLPWDLEDILLNHIRIVKVALFLN